VRQVGYQQEFGRRKSCSIPWSGKHFYCILYWFYYRQNTAKSCYSWLQDCHIL